MDVFELLSGFVYVGRLKRYVLVKRHRNATPNPVSVPSPVFPLVIGFVGGERLDGVICNRERMRDRDSIAIAVQLISRTKSSDIHVAVRDFELVDEELECPINSKLVFLVLMRKVRRLLRHHSIQPTCRNL